MKRDFFNSLPSEISTNILSRLPLRTIAISKCVCKPWLHLLATDDFESHLAKSDPCLALSTAGEDSTSFAVFELNDDPNLNHHDLRYNRLTKFDFPHSSNIICSANGFLFLHGSGEAHYVCNPITREYTEIHCPQEIIQPYRKTVNYPEILGESRYAYPNFLGYGFGVSKVSNQYKVVRIYVDSVIVHGNNGRFSGRRVIPKAECHVHTLGTGQWRRVEPGALLLDYTGRSSCVFLNGNLHWVASDCNEKLWISCFDLETESFSYLSTPPISFELGSGLSTLGECLCLCDQTLEEETVIWVMKEYGVEESWTKEYTMRLNDGDDIYVEGWELVYPIKVFEDGDILILDEDTQPQLFYYSTKNETAGEVGIFGAASGSVLFTPSFLSLKSLGVDTSTTRAHVEEVRQELEESMSNQETEPVLDYETRDMASPTPSWSVRRRRS
ncbi:F-box protein At3g07870-like [Salvia splendens]|uniref:F-box protein At3g07870-like n=1 Tax=Salvia splendens TaxID=180675 RepID=UPI001C27D453|nr:F-box protein At3g07870-like [Salvia splendens]XP_042037355.1 F-box protein At3g07870-like [Salvia splendens]XP_042037356.1 F-box protein At3g07870-like [Salvia splendens]XP_042037357.1 F-box protein At3g07870-like [Salvia splendens]